MQFTYGYNDDKEPLVQPKFYKWIRTLTTNFFSFSCGTPQQYCGYVTSNYQSSFVWGCHGGIWIGYAVSPALGLHQPGGDEKCAASIGLGPLEF
jgi:hypothetical protein